MSSAQVPGRHNAKQKGDRKSVPFPDISLLGLQNLLEPLPDTTLITPCSVNDPCYWEHFLNSLYNLNFCGHSGADFPMIFPDLDQIPSPDTPAASSQELWQASRCGDWAMFGHRKSPSHQVWITESTGDPPANYPLLMSK